MLELIVESSLCPAPPTNPMTHFETMFFSFVKQFKGHILETLFSPEELAIVKASRTRYTVTVFIHTKLPIKPVGPL